MIKQLGIVVVLLFGAASLSAQAVQKDAEGFPTFEYAEGDTVYHMKQYFLVLLYRGDITDQAEEEAARIQAAHLAHIQKMAEAGVLALAGPMGDSGRLRGVFVFNLPDQQQVEEWVNQDPAIQAGRLVAEIHPWWTAKGGKLP